MSLRAVPRVVGAVALAVCFSASAPAAPLVATPGTVIYVPGDSLTAGFGTGIPWPTPIMHSYDNLFLHASPVAAVSARTTAIFNKATLTVGPNGAGANYDPVWVLSGISGNTVADVNARIGVDLATFTNVRNLIVLIEAGTNDYFTAPATLRTNADTLLTTILTAAPAARIGWVNILCNGGSPHLGEQFPDPSKPVIDPLNTQLANAVGAVGGTLLDVRTPQQAYEQANNIPAPGVGEGILTFDGVHPIAPGRTLMSNVVLAAITVAP